MLRDLRQQRNEQITSAAVMLDPVQVVVAFGPVLMGFDKPWFGALDNLPLLVPLSSTTKSYTHDHFDDSPTRFGSIRLLNLLRSGVIAPIRRSERQP